MLEPFPLAVIIVTAVVAGFCFAMSRCSPREERVLWRRLRAWEAIARARALTLGSQLARPWFELQGNDPRVGPMVIAVEAVEGEIDLAVVVRIPLPEGPRFEFELAPLGRNLLHTGLSKRRREPLGDPGIERLFTCSTTDISALRALLDTDARGQIAAHPQWHVAVRGRQALVAWIELDGHTEEALLDDALDLLSALFRTRT